ncbi:TonB-dependent receptor [Sphingomonas turrisvirgatae]|uniref:TonB-dependent receptor n=1 Tax=Sphingomonas turrisvirgatae TaxID=1888892 RepID=A0A1E3LWQ9_9SPHN|nr:TonB-dependent receptor [Sphingomonas turrisvirgatae]ODP38184.1 TonB-dependent receptor [Sphingomonas turrisvirgatae]
MSRTALLLATSILAVPAVAQTAQHQERDRGSTSVVHAQDDQGIVVTAPYVADLDLLAGSSVVTGDVLVRDVRGQIGDTLTRVPGVSATSFTPGASRPVLRGFQGERVRVLSDGLGTLDVSNTSTDHAVSIDPLTAERIEVLRGPAVLLFGSQAIGGAVNVIDRRIPRALPENGFHIDAVGTYGSAADERSGGAALDVALTPQIVLHVDGTYRKTDDVRVGGFVLSRDLRADQLHRAEHELEEGHAEEAAEATALANQRGRLPNSGTRTYTAGAGISLINDGGSLGFSVGYYDTNYGVPVRPSAAHGHEEEAGEEGHEHGEGPVTIGLKQWRADLRGEVNVGGGFLDTIRLRAGFSDYQHIEFEGDEVGTTFFSQGLEGRLELVQADRNGWRGVTGFQGFTRKFEAIGAEAFVPPNQTAQYGLFTLQELKLGGGLGLEGAMRYEHTTASSNAVRLGVAEDAAVARVARTFDAFSGALGVSYEVGPRVKIGINASRAVRAPSAEELFSNGPHVATSAYEVGDPTFRTEKSWGGEVYARGAVGSLKFQIAGYANWFDDYIYETETGLELDGLPVFQYRQADARYIGVEGELSATLYHRGDFTVGGSVVADYVRATLEDSSAVPRIPPLRVLGGLDVSKGAFGGRVEVEHVTRQSRIAAFETATPAFTMVNASLTWHPVGERRETAIILSANNLFDVEARRHASFTKDFVPLAGRDIRVAARLSF